MDGIIYLLSNQSMPNFVLIETAATTQEMEADVKRFFSDSAIPTPFELVYSGIIADYKVIFEFLKVALSNYRINPERNFFTCSIEKIITIIKNKEVRDITNSYKEQNVEELLLPQSRSETSNNHVHPQSNYQNIGYGGYGNQPSSNQYSPPPSPPPQNYQSQMPQPINNYPSAPPNTTVMPENNFDSNRDNRRPDSNTTNFVDFRRLNIPINSIIICEKTQERALVKSNFVIEFRGQNTTLYNATRLALGDEFDNKKPILNYWSFNNKIIG